MKNLNFNILKLVLLLIIIPNVLAEQIDFNRAIFDIDKDNVHLINTLDINLDGDLEFEINLPSNFSNLEIKSGSDGLSYTFRDGKAVAGLNKNINQIIVEYDTKNLIKENSFVVDFESPLESKFVFLEVWIDEDYVAERINPEAEEIIKEEGKVKIRWMFKDFNEDKRVIVFFNEKSNLGYFIMPVFALIVVIYLIVSKRRFKTQAI